MLSPSISLVPAPVMHPQSCAPAQDPGKMRAGELEGSCQLLGKVSQQSFIQKGNHHLTPIQDTPQHDPQHLKSGGISSLHAAWNAASGLQPQSEG